MRGLAFAVESSNRRGSSVVEPFVVGAVIDLGQCLDLTTATGIGLLRIAYPQFMRSVKQMGGRLPRNSKDGLRRRLDCGVISLAHDILGHQGIPPADTVRGLFTEGAPVYPHAGFFEKTHVQIAVRNPACIKGVFRVPAEQLRPPMRTAA